MPLLDTGARRRPSPCSAFWEVLRALHCIGEAQGGAIRAQRAGGKCGERGCGRLAPTHMLEPLLLLQHTQPGSGWSRKGRCMAPACTHRAAVACTLRCRLWKSLARLAAPKALRGLAHHQIKARPALAASAAHSSPRSQRSVRLPQAPLSPASHSGSLAAARSAAGSPQRSMAGGGAGRFARLAPQVQDKVFSLQVQRAGVQGAGSPSVAAAAALDRSQPPHPAAPRRVRSLGPPAACSPHPALPPTCHPLSPAPAAALLPRRAG